MHKSVTVAKSKTIIHFTQNNELSSRFCRPKAVPGYAYAMVFIRGPLLYKVVTYFHKFATKEAYIGFI